MEPEETQSPKLPLIPIVVGVILVIGLAVFLFSRNAQTPSNNSPEVTAPQTDTTVDTESTNPTTAMEGSVKTFNITAKNFSFSLPEIRVTQGDRIKVILSSTEGIHDFVLDEFNVRTDQIGEQTTNEIEFTADEKGTFEYYCSIGKHRQMGMVGNLIVE